MITRLATVRRIVLCAIAAFAFIDSVPASAQESASAPVVTYPDTAQASSPLWSAPGARATVAGQHPMTVPLHPLPQGQAAAPGGAHANDHALQTKAGRELSVEPRSAFGGIVQDGHIPADPNIAVGPNHVVQVVNSEIAIFDKSGVMEAGYPKALSNLWTNLGGACAASNAGDPVVQYDRAADRWVVTQLANLSSPYAECIAVSQTSDPSGAYYLYSYSFGSNLNDYPKFGVWPTASNSAYLGTYNMFSNGQTFIGADLCAYDRAAMLAGGASPAQVCFQVSDAGVLPADVDGATPPSDGEPGYFLDFNSLSSLALYQLTPNFATPSASVLSSPTSIAVSAFQEACNGGTCIPQPATTRQLDSLGDRLMYRLAYRKFSDHEAMVVNHSVVAGSSVGLRWYELDATTPGNFVVAQQGTFAPDAAYRWMGSIAMDQRGDIAVGYSLSSATIYPSVALTGRLATDPVNTMGTETILQAGGGSQTGYTRWGDYTALRVDPSDDCTFWYTNEYFPQTASYNWYTYVGSFKFSSCGATASNADFSLAANPSSLTVAAGASNSAAVGVTSISGFNAAVALSSTCVAPLTCSFSPSTVTPAAGTSATSTLTIAVAPGAAAGSYSNTITGTSGGISHGTTFTTTVPTADFTITPSLASLTIARGSSGSDTITLKSGGSSSVTLTVSGLPRRAGASFSTNPISSNGSSKLKINVGPLAKPGTYALTVQGTNGTYSEAAPLSLTIK
jgi:hypothetical protein